MAVQVCEQIITGRNFDYASALEIIQSEEYLQDSDFVHQKSQKITHKHGRILEDIEDFQEKLAKNTREFDLGNENHRDKRSFDLLDFFGSTSAFESTNNYNITTTPFMIASTSLIAIAVLLASNPTPGLAPSSSPQPGSRNGGSIPETNLEALARNGGSIPETNQEALDLVPPGLTPVATFPNFATPRTNHRAVAVIFKEPEGTVAGVDPLAGRKKRGVLAYPYHVKNYKVNPFKETDWNDFWAQLEYDWDTEDFKIARKETVNIWESLQQNVKCLGPKLTQSLGRKPAPVVAPRVEDFNIDINHDFQQIPNREIGFLEKLKNTVTRYGAKLTVDQRVEDFNIDINDFEQIPSREIGFLEKLQNTVTRYGEKLTNTFTKKPEAEERDVLAYPDHIENYKVNPFKETDRANFWEQVEYDWDTDEFQWLRQEIGKGWEKNCY